MLDLGAGAPLRPRYGGVYEDAAIPAGTYRRRPRAVPTISIPNYIVVEREDERRRSRTTSPSCCSVRAPARIRVARPRPGARSEVIAPIRLHPGAQQYYDRAVP